MRFTRSARLPALAVAAALAGCPEPAGLHAPPAPGPALPSAKVTAAGAVDALSLRRPPGAEWFGLYLSGKKAGWTRGELKREARDGRDVIVVSSETVISVRLEGKVADRRQAEERTYEARPAGRLLTFRAELTGDGGDRTITGRCAPSGCTARVTGPGGDGKERNLGAVAETLDQAEGVRLAAARRATISGPQLELDKLKVRQLEQRFVGRERLAGAGAEAEVSVVSEGEVGDRIATEYRIADDGRVLQVTVGGAIEARPETPEAARKLEVVDLFALSRVTLPRPLPRTVPATITYRLAGLPESFRRPDGRQSFAPAPDGRTLMTVRARQPVAADPARDTARASPSPDPALVAATPSIDADHPEIVKLATALAGNLPGRYAATLQLATWVNRNVQTVYGESKDRASDVLAAPRGDCTEHALLLVALARALGIPAREVYGLVYARYPDGADALYWHEWAEVLSGGEWIAVDPTFGQAVADATHLALGTGGQADTVGLLGALKVEAVDVKP